MIYFNGVPRYPIDNVSANSEKGALCKTKRSKSHFDAITIRSSERQIEEKTFSETLSRSLIQEIKEPVSEEHLAFLEKQVQSGNYQIDVGALVSRILLDGVS